MFLRRIAFLPLAVLLAPGAARAQPCQLCAQAPEPQPQPDTPLKIDIETALDFSTAAHTQAGGGSVSVDSRTGARSFMGLVGVGGPALRGTVTITGQPLARVSVQLPTTIKLNSTQGAKAEITRLETTLGPDPMIGPDGRLMFFFGGRLSVLEEAAGEFHGRVQISVDYR